MGIQCVSPGKKVFVRGNGVTLCPFLIAKCTDLEAGEKTLTKKNLRQVL